MNGGEIPVIKVLVVEDSPVVSELLVFILESDPAIRVVGTARDGEEAIKAVGREQPDVVTMDIHMPKLNGLEATRQIMETNPLPIVIVSGGDHNNELVTTFDAMEAGAVAVLRRPAGLGHPDHDTTARELIQTVKLMAEVKVIRRWRRHGAGESGGRSAPTPPAPRSDVVRIVAIGASTGGPPVLQTILAALPKHFPAPIVVVQHMVAGFIQGMIDWLGQSSALPVHLARQDQHLLPGHVYIAPDDLQMKVAHRDRLVLTTDVPENGLRPSVACLFRSVAEVYGGEAVAVLLTGMGKDGAEQMRLLKDRGAVTIAQDKESSVVHGMPGAAIQLDGAMLVLPPEKIAAMLTVMADDGIGQWRFL